MSKVTFASLKLKTNTETKKFTIGEKEIEVLQYLPIADKNDLIQITLQSAEEDGIYNELKLQMYFELNIVYLYTNITFTDTQRQDEEKLYDILNSNGVIEQVLANMSKEEYNLLYETLEAHKQEILTYKNTAGAVIQSVIQDLPKNAQVAADIVNQFDPNKFSQVVNFARAANGDRNIITNKPAGPIEEEIK